MFVCHLKTKIVINLTQHTCVCVQQSRARESLDAGNPQTNKCPQGRGFAVYRPNENHLLDFIRCLGIVPRYTQRVPHLVVGIRHW